MTKRMVVMLCVMAVFIGLVAGYKIFVGKMIKKYIGAAGNPPQTVSTVKAERQPWQPHLEAVGSVHAWRGSDLAPQVAGTIEHIYFRSGDTVKAGQLLAQLSAADDAAKLASLQALADLDRITLDRDQQQYEAMAVAKATIDTDTANLRQARANVDQQRATLDYKTLRAPFAGRLGIRQVDPGQYVSAGTVFVTLQTLDPIHVDFVLPQQDLASLHAGQRVVANTDAFPKESFAGAIEAISPKVDTATRNVQVRATFPNPKQMLLPGMYATVSIDSGQAGDFITLPQTVISYNPYGDTVFVIDHKKDGAGHDQASARQQFITVGETRGDQVQVLTGVQPDEEIVSSGQLKLHNGSPVIVNNKIPLSNDANPRPGNE